MTALIAGVALALMSIAPTLAYAALAVSDVGSFYIGGRVASLDGLPPKEVVLTTGSPPIKLDLSGDFSVGQMYVQYVKLVDTKARYPLLMWHGGGLTGTTWETKPDGKPGFQMYFLNAGHDVYISDAVERGRSSWARYPEIYKTDPIFRSKREAYELFRLGPAGSYNKDPAQRKTYSGSQFPVEAFDSFTKQGVPRWNSNDADTQKAYDELVQKVCPCVIMVHSQGGLFGYTAALHAPDKVKAIIAFEPAVPNLNAIPSDLSALKAVPHVVIWGDNLVGPFWEPFMQNVHAYGDALRKGGADFKEIELPKRNIRGNSHMIMMDRNSDEVAALVQDWMREHGLLK
jgi:pimeloyl-ACP methyl ester carboxylesterase